MHRGVVLVGLAFSLSIACDRFDLGGLGGRDADEAEPASDAVDIAETAPEPSEAVVNAPTNSTHSTKPSPSESPTIEPSPSESPVAEPAASEPAGPHVGPPPMLGKAQQVLVVLLAGIDVPEPAVIKDIKKRVRRLMTRPSCESPSMSRSCPRIPMAE